MRVRPAEPRDIVLGQQLVCTGDDGLVVHVVEEVLRPDDQWKAFVAEDGCRYGLDGAYVLEVDPPACAKHPLCTCPKPPPQWAARCRTGQSTFVTMTHPSELETCICGAPWPCSGGKEEGIS